VSITNHFKRICLTQGYRSQENEKERRSAHNRLETGNRILERQGVEGKSRNEGEYKYSRTDKGRARTSGHRKEEIKAFFSAKNYNPASGQVARKKNKRKMNVENVDRPSTRTS
jgi:hypothetical protein